MPGPKNERDHVIGTSITEDGYVKLDFFGTISFLAVQPDQARKLANALITLANLAEKQTQTSKFIGGGWKNLND